MTRREKQCKGILSTSLLDAIVPSEQLVIFQAARWFLGWPLPIAEN